MDKTERTFKNWCKRYLVSDDKILYMRYGRRITAKCNNEGKVTFEEG